MCAAGSCSTGSAVTCDECLQLSSHCAWCTQEVSSQSLHVWNHNMWADKPAAFKNIGIFWPQWNKRTLLNIRRISQNFTDWLSVSKRCDTLDVLLDKGCDRSLVDFPVSQSQVLQDQPLGKNSGNNTQISPQKMALKLRPGTLPLWI